MSTPITASPHFSSLSSSPVHLPSIGISPKLKRTDTMTESWEIDVRECEIDIDEVRSIYKCCLCKLHLSWSLASMKAVFNLKPFSATTGQIGNLQRIRAHMQCSWKRWKLFFFMSVAIMLKVLNQLRVTGEGTIVSELLGDRFLNYYSFMHMDVVIQTRSKAKNSYAVTGCRHAMSHIEQQVPMTMVH